MRQPWGCSAGLGCQEVPKQVTATLAWLCCHIPKGSFSHSMRRFQAAQTPTGQCPIPAGAQGMDGALQRGKDAPKPSSMPSTSHHPFPSPSLPCPPHKIPEGLWLCGVGQRDGQGQPYSR